MKSFASRTIKVSEMQQLIKSGMFARWVRANNAARNSSLNATLNYLRADAILNKYGVKKDEKAHV